MKVEFSYGRSPWQYRSAGVMLDKGDFGFMLTISLWIWDMSWDFTHANRGSQEHPSSRSASAYPESS